MKVLLIDVNCGIRSTGRICTDLAVMLEERGHESKIAFGRDSVPEKYQRFAYRIETPTEIRLHALRARLIDGAGFGSGIATKRLITMIKEYNPDIIHLNTPHGYYLNLPMLFSYFRQSNKPILWSFYDCWAFTGHCAHFDYVKCDKWMSGCGECPQLFDYPKSFIDRSRYNYRTKKQIFSDVPNLEIIVPSKWMQENVSRSFMKKYPVHLLPNGIDTNLFHPIESDKKDERYIVLAVASEWGKMKGIDYINRLAEELDDTKYRLILVGNLRDKKTLNSKIEYIAHTNNIDELCCLYTMADVFVNPTLQETQGLTTVEAFACGTPAVVFRSGGAAECVDDTCGISVPRDDFETLKKSVEYVCENAPFKAENCRKKAETYNKEARYQAFINLYESLIN